MNDLPDMKFSESQIELIRQKAEEGAQLNDIQKLIQTEFQENITFMETRFLLSDLGVSIKSLEEPVEEEAETPAEVIGENSVLLAEDDAEKEKAGGAVKVSVDQVTRPGAIVNGSVVWSDGKSSLWAIDQMGRLSLDSDDKTYQPSQGDIESFQLQLREQMG